MARQLWLHLLKEWTLRLNTCRRKLKNLLIKGTGILFRICLNLNSNGPVCTQVVRVTSDVHVRC